MWAIATAMLVAVVVVNHDAQHKLTGFEIFIVGPAALLLYVTGFMMAIGAVRAAAVNLLAWTALLLNGLPFTLLLYTFLKIG